ncbi:MAG: hypothetical protein V1492_02520 [Candidatus Micrarchaeota archaeon]
MQQTQMLPFTKTRQMTGLKESSLRKLVARKAVPFIRKDGRVFFPLPAVEHIIKVQSSLPADAIPVKDACKLLGIEYTALLSNYINKKRTKLTLLSRTWKVYTDISGYRFYMSKASVEEACSWKNSLLTIKEAGKELGRSVQPLLKNQVKIGSRLYARACIHGIWERFRILRCESRYYADRGEFSAVLQKKNEYVFTLPDVARCLVELEVIKPDKSRKYEEDEIRRLVRSRQASLHHHFMVEDGDNRGHIETKRNNVIFWLPLEKRANRTHYLSKEDFGRFYEFIKESALARERYVPLQQLLKEGSLPDYYMRGRILTRHTKEGELRILRFGERRNFKNPPLYVPLKKVDGEWMISPEHALSLRERIQRMNGSIKT